MNPQKNTPQDRLSKTIWASMLTPEHMQKIEKEVIERFVPAGGYVCRKGDAVDHWMGVIEGFLKMSTVSRQRANQALQLLEKNSC